MIAQTQRQKRKSTGQEGAKTTTVNYKENRENFHEESGEFSKQTHEKVQKKSSEAASVHKASWQA